MVKCQCCQTVSINSRSQVTTEIEIFISTTKEERTKTRTFPQGPGQGQELLSFYQFGSKQKSIICLDTRHYKRQYRVVQKKWIPSFIFGITSVI